MSGKRFVKDFRIAVGDHIRLTERARIGLP